MRMKKGGKSILPRAGTSGRLGILDASKFPTYGAPLDLFIALIAGGDKAIRVAVEAAEDSFEPAGLICNPTELQSMM